MKTIIVLGATGMAGHVIAQSLEEKGYMVYRASRSADDTSLFPRIDVTDAALMLEKLGKIEPNAIINAVGLLQKECDARPDKAVFINAYLPQLLAQHFKNTKTKIIHLSTDCVFSGKNAPYTEKDFKDGDTFYDRSKALGEIINEKDLTFRMSIIGPDIDINGTGLFNWFIKQEGRIKGFNKAYWNGVTTIELAKAIDEAVKQNLTGLYHLTSDKNIDKFTLLELFKKHFKRDNLVIVPEDSFIIDKTLINTREDFDYNIPDYDTQIYEMSEWVNSHLNLYWFANEVKK